MPAHDPKDIEMIAAMGADEQIQSLKAQLFVQSCMYRYSYNFSWLGRPIIQYPEDIMAMQEIVWKVQPDLIIETGIAHGGSLILYASLLELLGGDRQVIGIDIDIRAHNRVEIERHPLYKRITLLEGSSIDSWIAEQVAAIAQQRQSVLVILDSNHTHDHVVRELELYAPLVTKGSYLVIFDTVVEDLPAGFFPDRPWDKGNNPKTAVHAFLQQNDHFEIDPEYQHKLLLSVAPDGYLRRIKD